MFSIKTQSMKLLLNLSDWKIILCSTVSQNSLVNHHIMFKIEKILSYRSEIVLVNHQDYNFAHLTINAMMSSTIMKRWIKLFSSMRFVLRNKTWFISVMNWFIKYKKFAEIFINLMQIFVVLTIWHRYLIYLFIRVGFIFKYNWQNSMSWCSIW